MRWNSVTVLPQSRVVRLRGFANHKYGKAFVVRVESRSGKIYTPEHFPGALEELKCGSGKFSINPVEASFARHDDPGRSGG